VKSRRLSLLLLAAVLVLSGAGRYRGLAPGSLLPIATVIPSSTLDLPRIVGLGSDFCVTGIAMQQWVADLRTQHGGRLEVVSSKLLQYPEQAKVWRVKFILGLIPLAAVTLLLGRLAGDVGGWGSREII
jgi:hypothetical protein